VVAWPIVHTGRDALPHLWQAAHDGDFLVWDGCGLPQKDLGGSVPVAVTDECFRMIG
jgi:hypothetical protein